MTSIVTGASGFVGKHLVARLGNEETVVIPHDQIATTKIKNFDYFYFLSSYGNLASQQDENEIFKANVEDLLTVLKQLKGIHFKSFVFISTSSVMLRTQTTYSRCKKAAEEILLAYMERNDVPICIIRPFSITGVGEQDEHLIPTLIKAAHTQKSVSFVPSPTHDFIDVEDVVDGILSLSQHSARGIFQLGTGIKHSNQEVKDLVERHTHKRVPTMTISTFYPYDTQDWVSTNFKARGYGWLPKKTLEQSIAEMARAYEKSN